MTLQNWQTQDFEAESCAEIVMLSSVIQHTSMPTTVELKLFKQISLNVMLYYKRSERDF